MRPDPAKSDSLVSYWMIFPLACALVVIGSKYWMISQYGSPMPLWDQWDAEGANLYPKYFAGTLGLSDLIAPHNEHRVLVTRLWSLLLIELSGYWDPLLQIVANSLLLGATLALFVAVFRPILDPASWIAFALFSSVMFSFPFGWQNTIGGFHSQWQFMLLFSIAGLLAILEAVAFAPRWWIALLLLLASYFSMASGALTVATAFAVCTVQMLVGRRSGFKELLALVALAAMTVAMVLYIPVLSYHAPIKAHSIGQFLEALVKIASWPIASGGSVALMLPCAILIQAPALMTTVSVIRQRPLLADRHWLLVALTGWVALQATAVAYGRAANPMESRYLDLFTVAVLLNGACLVYLAFKLSWSRRWHVYGAIALWLIPIIAGAALYMVKHSLPELADEQIIVQIQTKHLQAYLDTDDIRALENKPFGHIPYPNAQRLAMIASMPIIRALLPPALVGEASAARAQQRGLAQFTGRPIEALKNFTLRWGVLLIPVGLTLFLVGLTMRWWRKSARRHEQSHEKPGSASV